MSDRCLAADLRILRHLNWQINVGQDADDELLIRYMF